MTVDTVRIERLTSLMKDRGFDALLCHLPHHVLMASGYLPVLGQSLCILLADGHGVVIAPDGEDFFARDSWFPEIRTFTARTLDYDISPSAAAESVLPLAVCEKGLSRGVIGVYGDSTTVPTTYPAGYTTGPETIRRWRETLPYAELRDASELLDEAVTIKSPREIERITIANMLAEKGFEAARRSVCPGVREIEVAEAARTAIVVEGTGVAGVRRVGAWAFCMSGQRSASAYLAFQYSTNRHLEPGDSVVVHINCHADGFWTDLTRTFFVGPPSGEQVRAYETALVAFGRALETAGEGVSVSEVDLEARRVLSESGYGDAFRHPVGHGVGFQPGEGPILQPGSGETLANDMVFNLEPGIYIEGRWGMRICDVAAIRGDHAVVLSSMRRDMEWAVC